MSSYSYVGGQHLYPSARKKKKPVVRNPYVATKPTGDYGQDALYPGGYKGTPAPVDMGTWFTDTSQWTKGPNSPQVQNIPGGSSSSGGRTNPYADLINNMLNQTRADIGADSVADAASRDAAIRRLLISYGETPDLASLGISGEASGVLGKVMDAKTRGLASQNTAEGTSVKARMEAANTLAQKTIPRQLAGRGLARSGETGYQLGQQAMQHKQTTFDTLNEMLGNVEGAVGSYAANERARQRALAEAMNEAAWKMATTWEDTNFGGDQGVITEGYPGDVAPPPGAAPRPAAASGGMLSRSAWLARHPGGNYQNYVNAYRARNKPIYMGGAYRY